MTDIFEDLTTIPTRVANQDSFPLLGGPRFPIEELSKKLQTVFEFPSLSIELKEFFWLEKQEILAQIGQTAPIYTFCIPNLKGKLYWTMSPIDEQLLISNLLIRESSETFFRDLALKKTFSTFLIYEVLFQMHQLDFNKDLIPQFSGTESLPDEDGICLDVVIHLREQRLKGRLVIDSSLRRALAIFNKELETESSKYLAKTIELPIQLEVGRTLLSIREWSKVRLGDFILLDECLIDHETLTGSVKLTYRGHKKFSGELNNSQITITDVYED